MAHPLSRRLVLTAARNPLVARFVSRYGLRLGASRFVAGETLASAIAAVQALNADGLMATLDHLGESVTDPAAARRAADAYLEVLDAIAAAGVQSNISIKLTHMGLAISPDLARENLRRIVRHAAERGNFVRIDMEESAYTQVTLDLFFEVFREHKNVGPVIQAYLYRSLDDLRRLAAAGANVRLCKGAYLEPPSVAFSRKADVDANFLKLIQFYLDAGGYPAVATHDEKVIAWTREYVARRGIPRDRFEFQMLYGVRPGLQRELARAGYRFRVYVPFGREWYPYFTRRLAERPANLAFVIRNLFRR